jgi:P27 family predicted phage terminase small subunit
MGRRGPPPKPPLLKLIAGNPGHRPIPHEIQPTVTSEPPLPPSWLDEGARQEWERIAPELHRLGLLTVLDHSVFAAYCTSLARWITVEKLLSSGDGTLINNNDKRAVARMAARERADAMRYGAQFGIGPPNRARLTVGRPSGKLDGLLA